MAGFTLLCHRIRHDKDRSTRLPSHPSSFAVCPSTTPCNDIAIAQVQIFPMKASQACPEGAAGPRFMCSNTYLNKIKLPSLRAMLERCKALSSVASQLRFLMMKSSLTEVSPTASACALGKTLTHQLPAHGAPAGDRAVLLWQEEAEETARHFNSEFP